MNGKRAPLPLWHPAVILSTWFWSGLSPKAPGTVGSLAALPFGILIFHFYGAPTLGAASLLLFFIGWWSTKIYLDKTGKSDPGEVVIDEVAGIWLALHAADLSPVMIIITFLLFRLLDIWKPWPIGWLDRKVKGAFGVMLDDYVAGLIASVLLVLIKGVYYGNF
ncbi:MAG: phosphatidylglycerophosphatase A [Sneathiella sp.]|uniref:phosphatidylglycerophosphatase A family protein n=1 Tax=Sneathiella sp. TaxID=1964365 RepID=UPI000C4028A6|nr:phosphatidylglycerophosphatase A [Sneathiella sp.]MAL79667.1 phosphatidylglycerophosphatase A [Sneathiella sp.]|tara:strand:- start:523 stop:1014 length:492 start_codon:yes stop_codon:yes gene_type:complete